MLLVALPIFFTVVMMAFVVYFACKDVEEPPSWASGGEVYHRGGDTYISVPKDFLDEYRELVEEGYLPNRATGARRFTRREKGWKKEMYLVPREVYEDFVRTKYDKEVEEEEKEYEDYINATHPDYDIEGWDDD